MGKAIIDITAIIASICCKVRVAFWLIKLCHYVIVDVEGKYVMFHALNVRIRIYK